MSKPLIMGAPQYFSDNISSPGFVIDHMNAQLHSIDPELPRQFHFDFAVQRHNLMSLLAEANEQLQRYEHIYPFIKDLCKDQLIDPSLYHSVENVLVWVLNKGRGKRDQLETSIKDAWLTYIVVLSCAMIDKREKPSERQHLPDVDELSNKLFDSSSELAAERP